MDFAGLDCPTALSPIPTGFHENLGREEERSNDLGNARGYFEGTHRNFARAALRRRPDSISQLNFRAATQHRPAGQMFPAKWREWKGRQRCITKHLTLFLSDLEVQFHGDGEAGGEVAHSSFGGADGVVSKVAGGEGVEDYVIQYLGLGPARFG